MFILLNINQMIRLNNLDPDWQFASKHGKASFIGYPPQKFNNKCSEVCPCCFQYIYKSNIPICTNPKQLQCLGFGFPLFYIFLKNCMILLLLAICSYNALSLKKSFDSAYSYCIQNSKSQVTHRLLAQTNQCESFMIKIARLDSQVDTQEQILRITSFIIQLFFLIYMRDHIIKLDEYYKQRNISLSDYSIMLKNIQKQLGIQKKVRQFFANQFKQPHQIKQITLIPQYQQIQQLKKERGKLIEKLRKYYKKQQFNQQFEKDEQYVRNIDQAIESQITQSVSLAAKDQLLCQKMILVFNTQKQKQQILQQFKKLDFSAKGPYFGVLAQKITIKQAPQPKQILWDNVNVPYKTKVFVYILAWCLCAIVLAVATVFFFFMYKQKAQFLVTALENIQQHPDQNLYQSKYTRAIATVYILLLFIIFFNKLVMANLYHKITDIQRNQTRSKFQYSFGLKYALGLFFTTALMTLIVQAIIYANYYSHPYGVVEQQTLMFFFNAFLVPIYWLINPINLFKKLKRKMKFGKKYLTQEEANILMQETHYDMGKRYAQIIQTMWFTFLYSTLVPIGAFISLFGICLYYWTDKYNLLRRSSLGGEVSGHVVMTSMKLLDFTLILRPLGQLLFDIQIRHKTGLIPTIVMIVVAALYIILPVNKIINQVNPEDFNLTQKTYDEMKHLFKDTYHSEHPILKIIHANKHKMKLSNKGILIEGKGQINVSFLDESSSRQQTDEIVRKFKPTKTVSSQRV